MDMVSLMYGPQERSWQTRANCMGVDPDLFFPERGGVYPRGKGSLPGVRRPRGLLGVRPGQWREVRDLGWPVRT